jgi:hypothetical protein
VKVFYSAPKTCVFQAALKGVHLLLELRGRTVSLRHLKVYQNYVMAIPHNEVMLVDIAKVETKFMQSAQSLLAEVNISWPCGPLAFHLLSDEAYHSTVFALGKTGQKLGTRAAVTDPLIGGCIELNRGNFPRPNREFDEHGFAAFDIRVR